MQESIQCILRFVTPRFVNKTRVVNTFFGNENVTNRVTVPTNNKHIFLEAKKGVLIMVKVLRYSLKPKMRTKNCLKNFKNSPALCIPQFLKNIKKWVLSDSLLKKYGRFIFPKSSSSQNKHIFVRAKRVCLLSEKCLFWVCLLWLGTVIWLQCILRFEEPQFVDTPDLCTNRIRQEFQKKKFLD